MTNLFADIKEIILVNATLRNALSPKFSIASNNERNSVTVNNFVKVSDGKDRFWVKIESIIRLQHINIYIGIIKNNLISGQSYSYGDMIYLTNDNIIEIK